MLFAGGDGARDSLKAFFVDYRSKNKKATIFWRKLLKSLDNVGNHDHEFTLRGPDHSELMDRRTTVEDCEDKEPFILSLYNSLVKHCQCHCKRACDFMTANIGLNCHDSCRQRNAKFSKFNLLFRDLHGTQASITDHYWRNIQISVSITTKT
jgi:hypothetical protein